MLNFANIPQDRILYSGDYFFIIEDQYPVSPGHMLVISHRIVPTFFELRYIEWDDLNDKIWKAKILIEQKYKPTGYNIGFNCGASAGQTVDHFHCHVIPRYEGDMENPRGGIRHCIPNKGYY